jgi:hypothetical protein
MKWLIGLWRASTLICDPLNFGLKLNFQKTQIICMGTSRGVRSLKAYVNSSDPVYGNFSLKFQKSARSLGIGFDEKLTWKAHTNDIVDKVNFKLRHLSTFRCVLNEDAKKGLVDALVQRIFDYGDVPQSH